MPGEPRLGGYVPSTPLDFESMPLAPAPRWSDPVPLSTPTPLSSALGSVLTASAPRAQMEVAALSDEVRAELRALIREEMRAALAEERVRADIAPLRALLDGG